MSKAGDIAQSILNVTTDPCLHTVATQLNRLNELEASADDDSPVQATLGIGLCKAVTPLKVIIWVRENPIVGIGAGLLVVGSIFGAGYRFANRRK